MRIFVGLDPRAISAYTVLQWSIHLRSTRMAQIVPLILSQVPITRKGLTHFTYSRYLVPYLCGYQGKACFMDSDMLVLGDMTELFDIDFDEPVAVVKGPQRFEWPSLMMFNNDKCKALTPEYINDESNHPQSFDWADKVGELPSEWNHCVGYDAPRTDAKLVHFTMGIPKFLECRDSEYAAQWFQDHESTDSTASWHELMGNSIHAPHVISHLNDRGKQFAET